MILLPIVERELRVAARRGSTYWTRLLVVLGAMLVCFWLMLSLPVAAPAASTGVNRFRALSVFAFGYCLFAGIRFTSDSLSVEKREGTLGLLFLTDLKGYDVVLGKLAATSLSGLYGVLAVVPMLAIPLLMGGVTLGEFGRMALVAVNTLFFSLTAGIFASTVSRSARKAIGLTIFIIQFFTAFFPLYASWSVIFGRGRSVQTLFMLPSPGFNYFRALESPYQAAKKEF